MRSLERVGKKIRPTESRQETQRHVTARAARIVRLQSSRQCESKAGRENPDLRASILLSDDIKSSIFTKMTEVPLKKHLLLTTTKVCNDGMVREETQCNLESRQNSEVAMGVDAFVKGKNSKGSGSKGTVVCKNCGDIRLWARACRALGGGVERGTEGDRGRRTSKGKGTVQKKKNRWQR